MSKIFLTLLLCSGLAYAAPQYHAKGLKRTAESKAFLHAKKATRRAALQGVAPKSYDLSAKVSPPEDQGQCGSCWDFGITKALRSALMLVNRDPGRLAFNYLLNNCGPGPSQSGCNGGDFDAGQSMLNGAGPWLESQDPYTEESGRCMKGLSVAGTALTYEVVGSGGVPSFKDLALAVSQNHMLVDDVAVCGQWENYSGGIFSANECGADSINHIINLVGYDCETSVDASGNCLFNAQGEPVNGDGFLKAMNNWGTSWGEGGYMRTRAHVDAIADTAMYFTEAVPSPAASPSPVAPSPVVSVSPVPSPSPEPISHDKLYGLLGVGALLVIGLVVAFIGRKKA